MNLVTRICVAAVAATVALGAASPPVSAAPVTAAPVGTLQSAVDDLHAFGAVGAQASALVRGREQVAASGTATLGGGPMPRAGHFRIGSTTKTFVAVVVLQLVGEGRLSLDDRVARWLPGVVTDQRITVRNLLQHTSGIANYTDDLTVLTSADGYRQHRFDHYEPAQLAALAFAHPLLFDPGTHWSYSNTNYLLAGMIVRAVTGRTWYAEVQSRILRPLGLRDTSYPGDDPFLPAPHADGYQEFAPGAPLVDTTLFDPTAADSAGGMVSTTSDITRFLRALQRGDLLRPREMAAMHTTVLAETLQGEIPGLRDGLGIFYAPNRCGGYWVHPGDVPGFSNVNGVSPSGDRAVDVYRSTGLVDSSTLDARSFKLMDDTICG